MSVFNSSSDADPNHLNHTLFSIRTCLYILMSEDYKECESSDGSRLRVQFNEVQQRIKEDLCVLDLSA